MTREASRRSPFRVFTGGKSHEWLDQKTRKQMIERIEELIAPVEVHEVLDSLESDLMGNQKFEGCAREYSIYETAYNSGQSPEYIARQDSLLRGEVGDPDEERADPSVGRALFDNYMKYYVHVMTSWLERVKNDKSTQADNFEQGLRDGTFYERGDYEHHEKT